MMGGKQNRRNHIQIDAQADMFMHTYWNIITQIFTQTQKHNHITRNQTPIHTHSKTHIKHKDRNIHTDTHYYRKKSQNTEEKNVEQLY